MAEERVNTEELSEEFESERPGRRLRGIPGLIVSAMGVGLSLYALYWVLNPLTAQTYRTTFLAIVLAMTFLVYRGWGKAPERKDGERPFERPGVTDWVLAVLAVVALGYTLVTFDEFVRRSVEPNGLDLLFGTITVLLVLEATRRTVGWILPAVCLVFLAYAYFGERDPREPPDLAPRLRAGADHRADLHGPRGHLRRAPRRRRHLHRAVHDLRSRARVLRRREVLHRHQLRGLRQVAQRPGSHHGARGLPARHGVGIGGGHHGHPGQRHVADPAQGRLPTRAGRRSARRLGHRRDPVARRRWAPRPSSSPSSWGSGTSRYCCSPRSRRSSTTSGSCSRSRRTPAGSGRRRSPSRRPGSGDCCCASATTSARWS